MKKERIQEQESFASHSRFSPFPPLKARHSSELFAEVMRPCGRFLQPIRDKRMVQMRVSHFLHQRDPLKDSAFFLGTGVPLNWALLASYLRDAGVASTGKFYFPSMQHDLPHVPVARISGFEHVEGDDGRDVLRMGSARRADMEDAMSRAVGELLERHFTSVYRERDLDTASYEKKSSYSLDPRSLNPYLPWQIQKNPLLGYAPNAPLRWVMGMRGLKDRHRMRIPAQLVFWNYTFEKEAGEPMLADTNTNGSGGHFSTEEALLSGLLELIERDGFLIYWLNAIAPPRIRVEESMSPVVNDILTMCKRYRLDIAWYDTTSDIGIPSCTCVVKDWRSAEPALAIGAGIGFSFEDIMLQAAGEALAVLSGVVREAAFDLPHDYQAFGGAIRLGKHEREQYWKGKERLEQFSFFEKGAPVSPKKFMRGIEHMDTPAESLAYVDAALRALGEGYEVYWYEVQHSTLKALGYHVVKTIVPRLMHLYLREGRATLGARRLREVPGILGYAPKKTLNPLPHPFP